MPLDQGWQISGTHEIFDGTRKTHFSIYIYNFISNDTAEHFFILILS